VNAPADARINGELELREHAVDVLLDRSLGQSEACRDPGVALPVGHVGEDLLLPRAEAVEPRRGRPGLVLDEDLDDLRIDDGAALGDAAHGVRDLRAVIQPILEEIRATIRSVLQQRERVGRIAVVAEDDDTGAGAGAAQLPRQPDPVIGHVRAHADPYDGNVQIVFANGGAHGIGVAADGDEVDARRLFEHLPDCLADKEMVVGDSDAHGHGTGRHSHPQGGRASPGMDDASKARR